MMLNTLENSLQNASFLFLFLTMLLYWIRGSFFYIKKTGTIENLALIFCNILVVSILILRWIETNHFPLSNLYESLLFLSWSLLFFLFLLQSKTKEIFLGIIITPIILFINTFANFSLPIELQKSGSLVPALQSNWLMMHVTIMMLSYAALICGSLLSFAFLIMGRFVPPNSKLSSFSMIPSTSEGPYSVPVHSSEQPIVNTDYPSIAPDSTNVLEKIDNLSYRIIGVGFPLLTIGILSGAVWANETWGSYWSWDPKETWAFITWLIYSIYLHSRIVKGWKGQKPAIIASVGFLTVWVCYLGVNLFGKGLHSYGWFEGS